MIFHSMENSARDPRFQPTRRPEGWSRIKLAGVRNNARSDPAFRWCPGARVIGCGLLGRAGHRHGSARRSPAAAGPGRHSPGYPRRVSDRVRQPGAATGRRGGGARRQRKRAVGATAPHRPGGRQPDVFCRQWPDRAGRAAQARQHLQNDPQHGRDRHRQQHGLAAGVAGGQADQPRQLDGGPDGGGHGRLHRSLARRAGENSGTAIPSRHHVGAAGGTDDGPAGGARAGGDQRRGQRLRRKMDRGTAVAPAAGTSVARTPVVAGFAGNRHAGAGDDSGVLHGQPRNGDPLWRAHQRQPGTAGGWVAPTWPAPCWAACLAPAAWFAPWPTGPPGDAAYRPPSPAWC